MKIFLDVFILVGVGLFICGGLVIVVIVLVIDVNDEDIVKLIFVIFLFNVIVVFLFLILGNLLGFNDIGFGMWVGIVINDIFFVVVVG